MAKFDYLNTILIIKPVEPNTIVSLRSKYNTNHLKLFYFEDDISSVLGYDNLRSYKYTLYVSRSPELELYL